jgi:hypothetical protein
MCASRRCLGLRRGGLGFQARGTLGQDQRMGTGEIGGQRDKAWCHGAT